jgi:hypothetical protein
MAEFKFDPPLRLAGSPNAFKRFDQPLDDVRWIAAKHARD